MIHQGYAIASFPLLSFHLATPLRYNLTTSMAQPPDYNQVVKEREEFERDVNAAGVGYSGAHARKPCSVSTHITLTPSADTSSPSHTTSFSQSSYPADKSARPSVPSTTSYGQPSTPGMGYGATQNQYISQQPQPIGSPMHYYRTPGGRTPPMPVI